MLFPKYAINKKNVQSHKGDGSLVSSQEQKAVRILEINDGKPADEPVVNRFFYYRIPRHALHNLSNPKPGHTTGGSGRGARRSGQAKLGRIECQQNYFRRKRKSTVLSKKSKTCRLNASP